MNLNKKVLFSPLPPALAASEKSREDLFEPIINRIFLILLRDHLYITSGKDWVVPDYHAVIFSLLPKSILGHCE